jgi:hypothetical protein
MNVVAGIYNPEHNPLPCVFARAVESFIEFFCFLDYPCALSRPGNRWLRKQLEESPGSIEHSAR